MQKKTIAQKFNLNFSIQENGGLNIQPLKEPKLVNDIFAICQHLNFIPKNICQVGASNSGEFEFMEFIDKGSKAILFEPHPEFYDELVEKWGDNPNINIFQLGIYNKIGKFRFYEKWASTCLEECALIPGLLNEPIKIGDRYFYANCAFISGFDDGTIDLLLIDSNGAEWYCLEKLISRPKIICIETHYVYNDYKNPFLSKIWGWMDINNYRPFAVNESDTVFIKNI